MIDPTQRFTSRVEDYVRFRPSYPQEVIALLREECGMKQGSTVADIGSGTGIFSRLMLESGARVIGVEPNSAMRSTQEKHLENYPGFTSVDGTAEATTLKPASVDLITCAQSAHWFDWARSLSEFRRILKPDGFVVFLWNHRRPEASAVDREYEESVLRFCTDYAEVKRRGQAAEEFVGQIAAEKRVLENHQLLDYEALAGYLLSSSYAPQAGEPGHAALLAALRTLFDRHSKEGVVRMHYHTNLYYARLVGDGHWEPHPTSPGNRRT